MPYRTVKQFSDRGSIKDIQKASNDRLEENPDMPPTPAELRIKTMYEHAIVFRDQALIDSLGLIVMDGSATNPVSVLRHRLYVQELKNKLATQIADAEKDIELLVQDEQSSMLQRIAAYKQEGALNVILSEDSAMLKIASSDTTVGSHASKRSFWRSK